MRIGNTLQADKRLRWLACHTVVELASNNEMPVQLIHNASPVDLPEHVTRTQSTQYTVPQHHRDDSSYKHWQWQHPTQSTSAACTNNILTDTWGRGRGGQDTQLLPRVRERVKLWIGYRIPTIGPPLNAPPPVNLYRL